MTEDEAKTKWCPFVRLIAARRMSDGAIQHTDATPTFNRYNTDEKGVAALPSGGFCIGSACMAWRWHGGYPLPHDPPEISGRYAGFCGLTGKP